MSLEWDDEQIEHIKASYGKMTATQIANTMPGERRFTRSAIMGKASRLGLKSDIIGGNNIPKGSFRTRTSPRPEPKPAAPRPVRKVANPNGYRGNAVVRSTGLLRTNEVPLDLPNLWCEPVALVDLESHHCRWPMDGGKYCGLPKVDHASYCSSHYRVSVNHEHKYKRGVWVSPKIMRG